MFANLYREDELSTNLSYAALTMKLIFQFLRFLSKNMFRKQIDEISVSWFDEIFLLAIIPLGYNVLRMNFSVFKQFSDI